MKTSKEAIKKIADFEGIRLKAYLCPAGVLTIGVGHTGPDVKEGMTISKQRALDLFEQDIRIFENHVTVTGLTLTQNQFDALVSFAYNCGVGNLQRLVKGRDYRQIAEAMLLYDKAKDPKTGKKVTIPGLVRRRQWEHDLFLSDGAVEKRTGNPYAAPQKNLRLGSRGNDVRWLQYELTQAGYQIVVDGIFGSITDKCVRDFQLQNGLQVDGIVGPKTRTALID